MSVTALFTVRSNLVSAAILENLRGKQLRDPKKYPVKILIFDTEAEAYGTAQLEMVGLFDSTWYSAGRYAPARTSEILQKPAWLGSAYWAILVNPAPFTPKVAGPNAAQEEKDRAAQSQDRCKNRIDNCADQIRAMFIDKFDAKRAAGLAPWESPKKEPEAKETSLPTAIKQSSAPEAGIFGLKSMRCCP